MDHDPRRLPVPPAIRDYLTELVRMRFVERDPERVVTELPESMAEGVVERMASGGPFGWLIDARLDRVDGRIALEALEDDRMSGPLHYRVWDDGARETLPTERTGYGYPTDASTPEIERAEAEFFAHNRAVGALLRERGFR